MKSFESWTIEIFACHLVVLRKEWLSATTIDSSVQVSGAITITFPVFVALVGVAGFLLPEIVSWQSMQMPLIVALLILVFGVSSLTDRIYDRNKERIQSVALEIRQNPNQGTWWAARRLLKVYLKSIGVVAVAIVLVKVVI